MKKLSVVVLSMCIGLGAVGSAFAAETTNGNPMIRDTSMSKDMMIKNSISQNSAAQDNLPEDPAKAATPNKDDMNKSKDAVKKSNMSKDSMPKNTGTMKKGTMSKQPAKAPVSQ